MIEIGQKGLYEILLEKGLLSDEQIKSVLLTKHQTKKEVEEILLENNFVSKTDILSAKAEMYDVEYLELYPLVSSIDSSIPNLIKDTVAKKYGLIPIQKVGSVLTVAMKDPGDIFAIDDIRLSTSMEIKPVLAAHEEIDAFIGHFYYGKPIQGIDPIEKDGEKDKEIVYDLNGDIDEQSDSEQLFKEAEKELESKEEKKKEEEIKKPLQKEEVQKPQQKEEVQKPQQKEEIKQKEDEVEDEKKSSRGVGTVSQLLKKVTATDKKKEETDKEKKNISEESKGVSNDKKSQGMQDGSDLKDKGKIVAESDSDALKDSAGLTLSFTKGKIGNLLVKAGLLSEEDLEEALKIQKKTKEQLGQILIRKEFVEKKSFYQSLGKQMGIPFVDLPDVDNLEIPSDVIKIVPPAFARKYTLIPIEREDIKLKVAMVDPMNIFSIDNLRLSTGLDIIPLLADEDQILTLLEKYYPKQEIADEDGNYEKIHEYDEEIERVNREIEIEVGEPDMEDNSGVPEVTSVETAPIVKMVNIILQKAAASLASDVHLEPYEDLLLVRYRIDGQLIEVMKHSKNIHPALVARIKIISGLNIAEKRLPQDGRITIKVEKKNYDLRVSTLPTMFGEKVVIRLQDKTSFNVTKKDLGLFDDDMVLFEDIMSHPHGIVLVTGPTGSGKSTTLYTALRDLSKPNVNVLTVEDPVESVVRGVNQVQVNPKAGLDFSNALRSFLRQDPDIIMVGEIRDGDTAEIAVRAAITGHLVLSTLHTNDTASAVTRIIDMGIEPFLISSSIVGLIAQRLVRRLCPKCKEEYEPDAAEIEALGLKEGEKKIYRAKGCSNCNDTGYRGRIAIFEIMTMNTKIREMITKHVPSDQIKEVAVENGMRTLKDSAIRYVKEGTTSVEEMLRVTYSTTQ